MHFSVQKLTLTLVQRTQPIPQTPRKEPIPQAPLTVASPSSCRGRRCHLRGIRTALSQSELATMTRAWYRRTWEATTTITLICLILPVTTARVRCTLGAARYLIVLSDAYRFLRQRRRKDRILMTARQRSLVEGEPMASLVSIQGDFSRIYHICYRSYAPVRDR